MSNELSFVAVTEIPAVPKRENAGREPVKWEELLVPLTEKARAGKPFRVFDAYEKRTGADSRKAAVQKRLYEQVPNQKWTLRVRPISATESKELAGKFGVYVRYDGERSPEQLAAHIQEHDERATRIKNARDASEKAVEATKGAKAS